MKEKIRKPLTRLASLMLALLLLGAVAVTASAAEAEPACYGYGDVNGDNGVDGRDAIYTLYHVMFPDTYPVSQECDFNADGSVDSKDAIQVLYGSLGMAPECPLGDTVHSYYAPEWNWFGPDAVQVSFRCGCGSTTVLTQADGITIAKEAVPERSCTEVGFRKYTAKITFAGKEYTGEYTETIPATEHTMTGTVNCLEGSRCTVCGFTLPALGHDWEADPEQSRPATCQVPGIQAYVCTRVDCGEKRIMELEGLAEHNFQYVQDTKMENGCAYIKMYQCADCAETMYGDIFYKHTYTAKLNKEATCSAEGTKLMMCSCGDIKREAIPKNDSHTWDEGVTDDAGVTTLTCTGCGTTSTAMLVEGNQASVDKEKLGSSELRLSDACLQMDADTLRGLGDQIDVDVNIVSAVDIGLKESYIKQIGSNMIYDLKMYSDKNPISGFDGNVTVKLPYVLQEEDDVDCLDVWFISDDGAVEVVKGLYSNNSVKFQTNHFSYYTVTRLTPEQRCEHYGHAWGVDHQDPTCTQNGHHVVVCRRCGLEQENTVLDRIPHDYQETRVEPTCTEDGSFEKVCSVCRQKVSGKLPALGHAWSLSSEKSTDPGCVAAGKDVYICGNAGCTETYTEEKAALGHDYQLMGQVNSDCTTSGYEGYKCSVCGDEYKTNEVSPMGHDFTAESAVWEWKADYSGATVKLVCARNPEHTQTLTAVISKTVDAPNCDAGGEVTYKAVAAFNLKEYTDSKTVQMDKVGHQSGESWGSNAGTHYHECTVCGEILDIAAHTWGETTVITPATCAAAGTGKTKCTVCGMEKEITLKATGAHNFSDGVCTNCGFHKDSCDHRTDCVQNVDVSGFGLCAGSRIWWESCDCGEIKYLRYELGCTFGQEEEREDTLPNGETGIVYVNTCTDCGLILESANYMEIEEAACISRNVSWKRMRRNGATLLEHTGRNGEWFEHNASIPVETVDLTAKGLCGMELVIYRCHCGMRVFTGWEDDQCQWLYIDSEDGVETFLCSVCGATKTEKWTSHWDEENCRRSEINEVAFWMDGTQLYSFTNTNFWMEHSYEVKNYRMDGDSCEDGIYIEQVCSVCHDENKYYSTWHETVNHTETDIRDQGLCADAYYEAACLCGAVKHFGLLYNGSTRCRWEYLGENHAAGVETRRCMDCGVEEKRQSTIGEKDEACMAIETTKRTYTKPDGTLLAEGTEIWKTEDHDWLVTWEMSGASCEDGVKFTEVCRDCGASHSWSADDHRAQRMEVYDLGEYGMCAGELELYSCACGYESWEDLNSDCQWGWVSGDEHGSTYRCAVCGATRKHVYSEEKAVDSCHYQRDESITFSRNGKTLLKVGFVQSLQRHRYNHTFRMDGATCMDGYTVTETCVTCGQSDSWHHSSKEGHGTWAVSREMLVEGKFCSDLELVTYQCACGIYHHQSINWTGKSCDYYSGEYVEAEDGYRYTCWDCGGQELEKRVEEKSTVPCSEAYKRIYVYYQDGVELCRVNTTSVEEAHDWNYTYQLLGDDCEDGYRYSRTCPDCGMTRDYSGVNYDCWERQVSREVLLDSEAICGKITLATYDSPCGRDYNQQLEEHCDWSYQGYESGKGDIYLCEVCGLRRVGQTKTMERTGCDQKRLLQYTYSLDGNILLELNREISRKYHEEVAAFEMFGTTCEEGYRVNYTCVYCGKKSSGGPEYDHDTYKTAYYDLKSYGLCGGEIWQNSCACGRESFWNSNSGNCNWYYTGNTTDGLEELYCAQCNTYLYSGETGARNPDNCRWEGTFTRRYIRDGAVVLDLQKPISYASHQQIVESFALRNPSKGCEGGFQVNLVCRDCGGAQSTKTGTDHSEYTVEFVDLDREYPDSCGGSIRYVRCACGAEVNAIYDVNCENRESTSWSEEGADGYTHTFRQVSCDDCGLEKLTDEYWISDADNCKDFQWINQTFRHNDTLIKEYKMKHTYDSHVYGDTICQLLPGAVTCKDGITVTQTCKICGYTNKYTTYSHTWGVAERIDLTPYGSVCGGDLVRYTCPCGKTQRYDFAEDSLCDMDKKSIANFMPGTIDSSQYTTQGYVGTWSDSWIMTCAVTDPKCSLKIRMSEYWVDEDCMATEYQVWQLGYDQATGTWMQELKIPTGEKHGYHAYASEITSETLADGTSVEIYSQTCPNCASSYITKNYILDGTQTKYEKTAVNTKDNGENKRWYEVYEYGVENSGFRFNTLEREECTYANGTEYWYQYAYEYDFPAGCVRTCTYTNSDGDRNVSRTTAHQTRWSSENLYDSTCTQFGAWVERWTCQICGTVTSEYTYDRDPVAHDWEYDSSKETYVCAICGLENVNAASGSIVLEDVTEAWGSGTNYVVGYWNRGDVEARKYVSLILEDAEDEEVVLTDITFTQLRAKEDGITAISFSKADVQAAADAVIAERGYTGSYAIRFTFVPVSSEDTLDYAITFDSQRA